MFAKLLKHEWRSTRGVIGMLCVIILVCGHGARRIGKIAG